jgi:hypothetical protein
MPVCGKCGNEAADGKLVKGIIVCAACIKAEKLEQGKLITFYALARRNYSRPDEIKLLKAIYKETKNFYMRQECDPGWPFDHQVSKKSAWRRTPGWATPQEAVAQRLHSLRGAAESKRKEAEKADQYRDVFEAWAKENGYDITSTENPEEELV